MRVDSGLCAAGPGGPGFARVLALAIGFEALGVGWARRRLLPLSPAAPTRRTPPPSLPCSPAWPAVPRTVANAATGYLVDALGWTPFSCYALCLPYHGMLLLYKVAPWETIRPHKRRTPKAIALTPASAAYDKTEQDVRPAPSGGPAEEAADARTIARPMSPGVERHQDVQPTPVWAASSMSCCWPPWPAWL